MVHFHSMIMITTITYTDNRILVIINMISSFLYLHKYNKQISNRLI